MKYIGNRQQLLDNGFEYVEEFEAYVRHCSYTRDGQLYEDIFCVMDGDNHPTYGENEVSVDIPRYCTNDVYKEVAKDLIEKGILI